MKTPEQYLSSYRSAVQAAVPDEPVITFGILSRVGSTRSVFFGFISPLWGVLQRAKGRRLASGFPLNVVVAVTASRLIAFEFSPTNSSLKIKRTVMTVARRDVRVEVIPAPKPSGLHHLRFWLPDGTSPELEVPRGFSRQDAANQEFFDVIRRPLR